MLRIVLDTNVLVSAFVSGGKPEELLNLASHRRYVLLLSRESLRELTGALRYPKFTITNHEIANASQALMRTGKIIDVTSSRKIVPDDPDDNILINLALDGHADYIVTGDTHLLALERYKGIKIVGVDDMLKKTGLTEIFM